MEGATTMLGYLAMAGDANRAVIMVWEGVGWGGLEDR
jgi:hypothetical protein